MKLLDMFSADNAVKDKKVKQARGETTVEEAEKEADEKLELNKNFMHTMKSITHVFGAPGGRYCPCIRLDPYGTCNNCGKNFS